MSLLLTAGNRQDECNIFLTDVERKEILDQRTMLNDIHIHKFSRLMEWNCGLRMQSTLLLQRPEMIESRSRNDTNIQLLFNGVNRENGHWICTYYDGNVVHIFNSMNATILHPDQATFLDRLYPFHPEVKFHRVQQQQNATDCGLFAIAFAVSVCFGNMPDAIVFDQRFMRRHLCKMISENWFAEFPKCDVNPITIELERGTVLRSEQNGSRKRRIVTQQNKKEKLIKSTGWKRRKTGNASSLLRGLGDSDTIIEEDVENHYLGKMNIECEFCGSLNFLCEQSVRKSFSICCHEGKVGLSDLKEYPQRLKKLLSGESKESQNFKENIRAYNSALAFASMGAKVVQPSVSGKGPYVFRVHGQIYHNTFALHPNKDESSKYGQLYIIDTDQATEERLKHYNNVKCLNSLLKELDTLLRQINPYAEAFKMMREVEKEEENRALMENRAIRPITMCMKRNRSVDKNTYNLPTSNEVAVVFVGENGLPPTERDVCIYPKNEAPIPISTLSANADPMTYPLLFPHGEPGWTVNIKHENNIRNVTPLQYYSYRLSHRDTFNPCLYGGKLTQQYVVDAWSKVEGERLKYCQMEQRKLRSEMYCGLMDYIKTKAEEDGVKPGKMVILPSSFYGGPRSYQQSFMDGMGLVQKFGKPQLFITMTCNPKWPEIVENLYDGQAASDRPDLVARVFEKKVRDLKKELLDKELFGKAIAYIYVIEFQKRGLPHIHLLLFLEKEYAIRDAETVDRIISAEIPDQLKNPRLYAIVKQFMIHGPCGNLNRNSPCMDPETNSCTKKFPKPFISETVINPNGYPSYRRRDDRRLIIFAAGSGASKERVADNRFVVPFNPYLSLRFNCHLNVEVCSTVQCIKYLFKYCYKGHDCAIIELKNSEKQLNYDEIYQYLSTRYVCPPEAMHRLYGFKMHEQSHGTVRLEVHLENQQHIYFNEGRESKAIENFKNTKLTAWFELNQRDSVARQYLYSDIPHYYVFNDKTKSWKIRERNNKPIVSRLYFVSPNQIERYYLRLLLLHVRGAQSFNELKTYEGTTYETFLEAAKARNLVVDDKETEKCLEEAIQIKFPKELCYLFAYICVFCLPSNADKLWEKYKEHLIDLKIDPEIAEQLALKRIEDTLMYHGFILKDFALPDINPDVLKRGTECINDSVDLDRLKNQANDAVKSLFPTQKQIFDEVMKSVNDDDNVSRYFYIDGPGGSGKSFLLNAIIMSCESEDHSVLSVAWTGIAANLLRGGRTVHSMFKLPIPITEGSTCNVSGLSNHAKLIRKSKIIIWDEVTMTPKDALHAVDSLLQDLTGSNRPFGGKVVILSGDFRQTLPIVRHGGRTKIIEQCIKRSRLWKYFKQISLTNNLRVNPEEKLFMKWLLDVGSGKSDTNFERLKEVVQIPSELWSSDELVDEIYGNVIDPQDRRVYGCSILAPMNCEVFEMNHTILSKVLGESREYYSIDTNESEDSEMQNLITVEFMNSLTPDGFPPHKLTLKIGAVVMLLRNMNLSQGLCNGTRLVITKMMTHSICAEIISGRFVGEKILLPRVKLSSSSDTLPFTMVRRQFPIRLAYAMTINKSQGQSFDKVGVHLPSPVFSHGQLYVAVSRVRSMKNLKILLSGKALCLNVDEKEKAYTRNVVFKDIL